MARCQGKKNPLTGEKAGIEETRMFTPLRRFELGKMFLSVIPVLVGSAVFTKIFTEMTVSFRIGFATAIGAIGIAGFLILPKKMEEKDPRRIKEV